MWVYTHLQDSSYRQTCTRTTSPLLKYGLADMNCSVSKVGAGLVPTACNSFLNQYAFTPSCTTSYLGRACCLARDWSSAMTRWASPIWMGFTWGWGGVDFGLGLKVKGARGEFRLGGSVEVSEEVSMEVSVEV